MPTAITPHITLNNGMGRPGMDRHCMAMKRNGHGTVRDVERVQFYLSYHGLNDR